MQSESREQDTRGETNTNRWRGLGRISTVVLAVLLQLMKHRPLLVVAAGSRRGAATAEPQLETLCVEVRNGVREPTRDAAHSVAAAMLHAGAVSQTEKIHTE